MSNEACDQYFETLYSAHSADVMRYAMRHGADHPDAEEIVVETFLVCWRRLSDVPTPALPWLLAVARRVLANRRRADRRRLALRDRLAVSERSAASGGAHGSAEPTVVRRAVDSLPDSDREVLALVVWQGLTHEAAATVLGCSRNAVTKRYLRACRSLKALLSSSRT